MKFIDHHHFFPFQYHKLQFHNKTFRQSQPPKLNLILVIAVVIIDVVFVFVRIFRNVVDTGPEVRENRGSLVIIQHQTVHRGTGTTMGQAGNDHAPLAARLARLRMHAGTWNVF